jgi:hypothetical protein
MYKLQMPLPRGLTGAPFGALRESYCSHNSFTNHFNKYSTIRVNNMKLKYKTYTIASI